MPKLTTQTDRFATTRQEREEVVRALLHADRARHDELGRTLSTEISEGSPSSSSPREQAAAPIDLNNVDE